MEENFSLCFPWEKFFLYPGIEDNFCYVFIRKKFFLYPGYRKIFLMLSLGNFFPLSWIEENLHMFSLGKKCSCILDNGKFQLYFDWENFSLSWMEENFPPVFLGNFIQDRGKCFPKESIEKIFLYLGWRKNFSRGKHKENFPLSRVEENFFPRKT